MTTYPIALDVHAHLIPVLPDRLDAIDGVSLRGDGMEIDGHAVGMAALYQPEALIAWMDRHGVAKALISAPPPTYRSHLEPEQARRWAAYLNDGLRAIADRSAGRLVAALHLPAHIPAVAVDTARQAASAGQRFFSMPAEELTYSHAAMDPLWRVLDQCAAFVFVHPGSCCDGRLRDYYLSNLLGNPYETTVAAAHLILGGVVECYPDIRFCLAHGGGCVPFLAGRWQRGFATDRPGIETGRRPPAELVRRFYVDSIVHDPDALELVAAVVGRNRILFGSDWPFPMGITKPETQFDGADAEFRSRIFDRNSRPLLRDISIGATDTMT